MRTINRDIYTVYKLLLLPNVACIVCHLGCTNDFGHCLIRFYMSKIYLSIGVWRARKTAPAEALFVIFLKALLLSGGRMLRFGPASPDLPQSEISYS